MLASILVIAISGLLFIATQFYFPIIPNDQVARNQRHFWAIILTIFSIALGWSIKSSYEAKRKLENVEIDLQKKIENVGSVFRNLSSREVQEDFQNIFVLYQNHFDHAQPVLKHWAKEAVDQLLEDMIKAQISLPRDKAATEIGKVYEHAKSHIVATNVGGTKFYFDDRTYIINNQSASQNVPIVRFYLYRSKRKIELSGSRIANSIEDFYKEVNVLHEKTGAVYSVVIDLDAIKPEADRDLLLLDNKFVAETLLTPEWEPTRVVATEEDKNLNSARQYFRNLMGGITDDNNYISRMSDAEIKTRFHKYHNRHPEPGKSLADLVFREIMREVTGIP